jgi:hypothetical protein
MQHSCGYLVREQSLKDCARQIEVEGYSRTDNVLELMTGIRELERYRL